MLCYMSMKKNIYLHFYERKDFIYILYVMLYIYEEKHLFTFL